MIAALFIDEQGPYSDLEGVDAWGESRDARLYGGPHAVVAHPPCKRWGRFAAGGPSWRVDLHPRPTVGDDGGCFAAALSAVRRFGGVIEHPCNSYAWRYFGLAKPPRAGGWYASDLEGGFSCCVEQRNYGHLARKATWLYAVGAQLPSLIWEPAPWSPVIIGGPGFNSAEHRAEMRAKGLGQHVRAPDGTYHKAQYLKTSLRHLTPLAFRDVLLRMARSVYR